MRWFREWIVSGAVVGQAKVRILAALAVRIIMGASSGVSALCRWDTASLPCGENGLGNLEMAVSLDFSHFQQIGWK
jgi:hypothetical protein